MSSLHLVSSEITIAKKITVTAMYHDVMIQFTTRVLSMQVYGADVVTDIDEDEQHRAGEQGEPHS